MSERDYRPPTRYKPPSRCPRCGARHVPGVPHECNEEPPQDQLTIDAFPEYDGVGPVPYNVIPYRPTLQ